MILRLFTSPTSFKIPQLTFPLPWVYCGHLYCVSFPSMMIFALQAIRYRVSKSTFYNGVPVKCVRDSIFCPAWFITCSLVPFLVCNFSGGGGGAVCLRYPDISEIWLRFFLNMPQICLRYSRDMNHIWLRYSLNECLRYAWDLPRISLK